MVAGSTCKRTLAALLQKNAEAARAATSSGEGNRGKGTGKGGGAQGAKQKDVLAPAKRRKFSAAAIATSVPHGAMLAFFCPARGCRYFEGNFFVSKQSLAQHYQRCHTEKTGTLPRRAQDERARADVTSNASLSLSSSAVGF